MRPHICENSIELQNLSKSFGDVPVLCGVSLSIPRSSISGIIGRSGAGKTTLLRCMNALEKPDAGSVKIEGQENLYAQEGNLRKMRKKIGMVFQSFNLLSNRSVWENIALPLEIMKYPKKEIEQKVKKVLSLVRLEEKKDVYPRCLSGGQKQRVSIARALVSDCKILLCDEFTSALDPETTLEMLGLLRDINEKLGVTIVLITHDMSVIREICDFVYVVDKGTVMESGSVQEVFYAPQEDITKSLIQTSAEKEIPATLKTRLKASPSQGSEVLLRLTFANDSSQRPIVAELIKEFDLSVNIVAGYLDHLREITLGTLLITFPYNAALYPQILKFFEAHRVQPESLGYLKGKS